MSSRQTSDSAYLAALMGGAIAVLFTCSSLRHALFQSTPLDLALFDQLVYLVSQGLPPISSFLGFHLLGDHAAIILYPIALLYKLVPSVYWLFFVQAIALAARSCSHLCAECAGWVIDKVRSCVGSLLFALSSIIQY